MHINFVELNHRPISEIQIFLVSDKLTLSESLQKINDDNNNIIQSMIGLDNAFKGKLGVVLSTGIISKNATRILLVGTGNTENITRKQLNSIGASIATRLNIMKATEADIIIEGDLQDAVKYIAEGIKLRNYKFNKYYVNKKKDNELTLSTINFLVANAHKVHEEFAYHNKTLNSIIFTRDLVNEPGNIIYPESFAQKCIELSSLGLKIKVLDENQMKELGMGSLLAVGQGSTNPSRLVVIEWWGNKESKEVKPLALVGKGVTFDTGGINLKSSTHIAEMKYDMSGAAVVAGVMKALAEQKINKNVVGFLGLVENMPSGTAQRPSDVVTSMSGQTIEVENTDAEGRMVLADAMWYAQKEYQATTIIDLATLTGAIGIALGDEFAGLFSNDDNLAQQLIESGKEVNELLWRMPLSEHYDNRINSDIADIRNTGRLSGAGATTAAQFLQRFLMNKSNAWAHLDIAGVSYTTNGELTNGLKGATGFGVRLLTHFINSHYEG